METETLSAAAAMRKLLVDLNWPLTRQGLKDLMSRPLVCTPFGGAYGRAGAVICLEGSPPRGTVLAYEGFWNWTGRKPLYYIGSDWSIRRARIAGDHASAIVAAYYREEMAKVTGPLAIAGGML